ncbi:cupin domain-containing protein [Gluconacetobacter tumulisoli]|uniref:Cupin domain-containing protein n=1 Tax=Gluconacetobacter tumulisoli TaxID=1286189 RepID=A0A7W4K5B2_9PROT|nr:cupin domain-containing protein [Gluconacetobacter tumulisoli]MBB2200656.1 cupin domain-containing protein [Gluconacetobacter tumulisoli]
MRKSVLVLSAGLSLFSTRLLAAPKITPLLSRDLAGRPGEEAAMLTVTYGPGEGDPVHRHDAQVFVYVLQGTVTMQVRGSSPVTLHEGQTFYEGPNDIHVLGRNASRTAPARFLVFFVKKKETPFVVPAR